MWLRGMRGMSNVERDEWDMVMESKWDVALMNNKRGRDK